MDNHFTVADTAKIYPAVFIGDDSVVENYVLIGVSARGMDPAALQTKLGKETLIRSHTVIYAGNQIGDHFQTGHGALIREDNRIGDYVSIGSHSVIEHHVQIGHHVRIHSNVFIPEYSILEDSCWIGPNVVFTNARYPLSKDAKKNLKGPHILSGAKIGANSTLLPGIVVGRNALVGAGSVVIRDVPDDMIVVGNPARVIGNVNALAEYQFEINL